MKLADIKSSFRAAIVNELKRCVYNAAVILDADEIGLILAETLSDIFCDPNADGAPADCKDDLPAE